MRYLLDTNICIHFIKNDFDIALKIKNVGFLNCFISELTILELMYGVSNSSSPCKIENYSCIKGQF